LKGWWDIVTTELIINKVRVVRRNFKIPPVSALKIAEDFNVKIHYYDHPSFAEPFTVKLNNNFIIAMPMITQDYYENYYVAKQLGHICLGHFDYPAVDTLKEDNLSDKDRKRLNSDADVFANELLLPTEWLWKEWNLHKNTSKIAEIFHFPEDLAAKRVECLGRPIEEQYITIL